ncbi:hypothetical protein [Variovorax paradoxus]|uniref:hypothetical protein n=1 Tax=Variovorax paradoxus TaxID=34073 RepID=UPI0029C7C51A|nr:hypothetical protein RZE77_23770 [Variovorax paradoxus]
MIWQRSDIHTDGRYKLHLYQAGDGKRLFRLIVENSSEDHQPASDVALITQVVPNELLKRGDLLGIARQVTLEDGHAFFVDAHGVWYTEDEIAALNRGQPWSTIQWVTGAMPWVPDR